MLIEGRKPRARKMPAVHPKELALHRAVVITLRRFCRPEFLWWHTPNGELRDKRTAAKLKAMGVKPGIPDILLLPPSGLLHSLELKRQGEPLTGEQEEFQTYCISYGLPHVVAHSISEALTAFVAWKCLRINITE
jgi:hypothetical protein